MDNLAEKLEEYKSGGGFLYKARKYVSNIDGKGIRKAVAACLIGTMLAGGSIYSYNYRNTGYAVKYKGQLLGYVRSKTAAIAALESAKEDIKQYDSSINVSDSIEFDKLLVSNEKLMDPNSIRDTISSGLYQQYTSYAIVLNDKDVAIVKNEDEANKVIEEVKKHFEDEEKQEGASEVLNINIKDNLKFEKRIADVSKIKDTEAVVDMLVSEKGKTQKYIVNQGDTIWKISKDNNMSLDAIAALNPGVDMDKLQIGQSINLSISEPVLNVETTVKVTVDENVPYDTKYVNDDNLYKGQTKVVESGQYGINRLIKQITKLNGKEIASAVISSALVKDPVTRIMAKGTKNLVGSGQFMWPTSGRISSPFGYRGREYHQGLDIAAPMGTPIYAADSGTVVHSGRYSGYGNLVIIDHGNGYKTYYGHCSKLLVSVGDSVKRGDKIALVGMTGQATGPHCHFEVRVNGVTQNPLKYLK